MGNDAALMAEAAGWMAQLGADVVDTRLPRCGGATGRRLGDAAGRRPAVTGVNAMREAVPGMLSAKIRAGFDRADPFLTIGRAIEETGVDYLVVHPRKRSDFYQGVADWRIVRALKQELSIPVVGNGDIWYADDAFRIREETGCDAVMLGCPARNPWIFQQIESRLGQTRLPRGDWSPCCRRRRRLPRGLSARQVGHRQAQGGRPPQPGRASGAAHARGASLPDHRDPAISSRRRSASSTNTPWTCDQMATWALSAGVCARADERPRGPLTRASMCPWSALWEGKVHRMAQLAVGRRRWRRWR